VGFVAGTWIHLVSPECVVGHTGPPKLRPAGISAPLACAVNRDHDALVLASADTPFDIQSPSPDAAPHGQLGS
jgi:hypothetical protein